MAGSTLNPFERGLMKPIPLIWLVVLVLATVLGCGGRDEAFLDLAWEDFDQDPTGGWRTTADNGDYPGAARMIETYLAHRDDLLPAQIGYSRFHAGQLWALHGETDRALTLFDQATVTDMPPEFPQSFNALVLGTRSFLRGDMVAVRGAHDEVAAMPGLTMRDSMFLEALEVLSNSEGMTYLEVYEAAVE
jgi:hypothetical protein